MNMFQVKLAWVAIRAAVAAFFGDLSDLIAVDEDEVELPYDYGLIRYDDADSPPDFLKIVVATERDKEQVLALSKYFHDLRVIDTDYVLVNSFAHLYHAPHLVEVQDG